MDAKVFCDILSDIDGYASTLESLVKSQDYGPVFTTIVELRGFIRGATSAIKAPFGELGDAIECSKED